MVLEHVLLEVPNQELLSPAQSNSNLKTPSCAEQGGQASTASLMDISEGEGRSDSFGEGKVQSDLAHWLK